MSHNYGKLLDKYDKEKATSVINEDLHGSNLIKLRKLFFSDTVSRLQNDGSTLLEGVQGTIPINIAPFLYFYKSISMQICPHCPQARKVSLIKSFLDKKLISVFLTGKFSEAPSEFQKLVYEYPEFFVGENCLRAFEHFSLNTSPLSDPNHYVYDDIKKKVEPYIPRLKKLQEPIRNDMMRVYTGIMNTAVPISVKLADSFVKVLKKPNQRAARELLTSMHFSFYLSSAKALGATPQIDSHFFESSRLFLQPLRIYHNQNLDLDQYLEIVNKFRGILSPDLIPSDKEKILSVVTKINDEVRKIETSNRLPLGIFLSKFVTAIPTIITRVATQGSYGLEGVYEGPPKGLKSAKFSKMKTVALAKYFGVSEASIQVWRIRSSMENRTATMK